VVIWPIVTVAPVVLVVNGITLDGWSSV
jgi:hypothetical protein